LNDFHLHSDGGEPRKLLEHTRLARQQTAPALARGLLHHSRLALFLYHRLIASQTVHDHFYRMQILQGQTPVRAGLTLLSALQQRHGFAALVVILPAFMHPFAAYQHTHLHARVFQAAEGLPGLTVVDLLPSFASLDKNAGKFSYDGVHLNAYGHQAMADILLPMVQAFASVSVRHTHHSEMAAPGTAADVGKPRR
jgi:hypothetical protein